MATDKPKTNQEVEDEAVEAGSEHSSPIGERSDTEAQGSYSLDINPGKFY